MNPDFFPPALRSDNDGRSETVIMGMDVVGKKDEGTQRDVARYDTLLEDQIAPCMGTAASYRTRKLTRRRSPSCQVLPILPLNGNGRRNKQDALFSEWRFSLCSFVEAVADSHL